MEMREAYLVKSLAVQYSH